MPARSDDSGFRRALALGVFHRRLCRSREVRIGGGCVQRTDTGTDARVGQWESRSCGGSNSQLDPGRDIRDSSLALWHVDEIQSGRSQSA
eukprot:2629555-Prymnesium_polylepis.1